MVTDNSSTSLIISFPGPCLGSWRATKSRSTEWKPWERLKIATKRNEIDIEYRLFCMGNGEAQGFLALQIRMELYNCFALALKRVKFWGVTLIRSDTWFRLVAVFQNKIKTNSNQSATSFTSDQSNPSKLEPLKSYSKTIIVLTYLQKNPMLHENRIQYIPPFIWNFSQ